MAVVTHASRCFPKRRYISDEGVEKLPDYQYSGCDHSLLYRWFCSPLAEMLVQRFVPLWMAPNLITVLGLAPSFFGHSLVWYYCPDLRSECPSWCWAVLACCTFLYQTIDNMDGKQARRTKTSSALGLLMDHGVDAVNITLSSLNIMALFRIGGSAWLCMAVWLAGAFPFFFATWEEFYTGTLYLGVFNGPTDGVLIICGVFMVSALVEDYTSFWDEELSSVIPVPRKVFAVSFFVVCVLFTVAANVVSVVRTHLSGSCVNVNGIKPQLKDAFHNLAPFLLGSVASTAWVCGSSNSEVFESEPRMVIWLFGLVFTKLVLHLQLAHLCGEHYHPWRKTWIVISVLLLGTEAYSRAFGPNFSPPFSDATVVRVCVVLALISLVHAVWSITLEMACILDVDVFSIRSAADMKNQ